MSKLPPISYILKSVGAGPVDLDLDIGFVNFVFPKDRREELANILKLETNLLETTVSKVGLGADGLKVLDGLAKGISTLRRYIGLQKLTEAADLIEMELCNNVYEKVVIFAIHRSVIEGMRTRLSKFGAVTLYGGTPAEKRISNVERFQKDPNTRVFIGNISAVGLSVDLTAAHHISIVECEWDANLIAQAALRCHKAGQKNPVTVRIFSLSNSVDEKICERLRRKTKSLTEDFRVQ